MHPHHARAHTHTCVHGELQMCSEHPTQGFTSPTQITGHPSPFRFCWVGR
eukprot:NODE_6437_length_260_cov_1.696682_g6354_i0.p3 GENE.NODE_6437_length_260_cov_1.696682_g6354_i0~~NODE_6437_length_260_cov_1.696682_g6354_i0.p3  ORF type:complete len:50 (+),score=10.60 NODE_6437_length_260_cov_1.696682_g6354_i0:11-160(+)